MEKGCETCAYFSYITGECVKEVATQWQARSCDTSSCPKYDRDPFWDEVEG